MNELTARDKIKQALRTSLANSSGADRTQWVESIVKQNIPLVELIDLLYLDYKTAIKFSWMIGTMAERYPKKIYPVVTHVFENIDRIKIPNFHRTMAKMFYLVDIPEEIEGAAVDSMFNWLLNPKVIVSTKNYSLFGLYKLTEKYDDLKIELKEVIEDQLDKNSNDFKKRAKLILQKL